MNLLFLILSSVLIFLFLGLVVTAKAKVLIFSSHGCAFAECEGAELFLTKKLKLQSQVQYINVLHIILCSTSEGGKIESFI